jgi:hypothetical protein
MCQHFPFGFISSSQIFCVHALEFLPFYRFLLTKWHNSSTYVIVIANGGHSPYYFITHSPSQLNSLCDLKLQKLFYIQLQLQNFVAGFFPLHHHHHHHHSLCYLFPTDQREERIKTYKRRRKKILPSFEVMILTPRRSALSYVKQKPTRYRLDKLAIVWVAYRHFAIKASELELVVLQLLPKKEEYSKNFTCWTSCVFLLLHWCCVHFFCFPDYVF